ncbi:MAG: HipA protein [Pseudomonadota bacterium]|nr:HipA protein [Pseudomonadota bacterium]
MDRIAVIWTRLNGQPLKMGTLVVTDTESRFSYEPGYRETGLRGLGLVYNPENLQKTITRARDHYFDLLPPLQSLVPPRSENNFQRALLVRYLESIHVRPKTGFDTDWEILIRAGHGAIGHLDLFASDEAASQWYSTPSRRGLMELDGKFGFSLKEFMTWFDDEAKNLIEILGPTPSVGGAIPKLPLSIPRTGWNGYIGLPTRSGDTDRTDILLKLEKTSAYPGIIELEILGLEAHRKAGFDVPRYWPVEVNGLRGLAIERFDRNTTSTPIFMESLYSILASGNRRITNHYSATYDFILRALGNPHVKLVNDIRGAQQHLVERLIMAMLTGNGDLHLENLSLLERNGKIAFSPVYDPTPMRAYQIHNMITPPGMSWGDYGNLPDDYKKEMPIDFHTAWIRFFKQANIRRNEYTKIIQRLLDATRDYEASIGKLKTLPDENKNRLIEVHRSMREEFGKFE